MTTWEPQWPNFSVLLKAAFPILSTNDRLQEVFSLPIASYQRPANLRSLLVHTKPSAKSTHQSLSGPAGTHPCQLPRCKTCALVLNKTSIQVVDQQHVIRQHFTCKSTSLIYLISCMACNAVYVGETGCHLHERMNGHRFAIKHNEDTPVAKHFNLEGHAWRVSALQYAPVDTIKRRTIEKVWISRFRSSRGFTSLNRDDGLDILLLPNLL